MFAARNMLFTPTVAAGGYDADAVTYFAALVTAGSSITTANKQVVSDFITGCKSDGIWTAIKACCLLAGPDDLTGALVPLVGSAPTNTNFVSGDHSRTTGLIGNGTTKQLDSNRAGNADGQNTFHGAMWISTATTLAATRYFFGTATNSRNISYNTSTTFVSRINQPGSNTYTVTPTTTTGLIGINRSSSTAVNSRYNGTNYTATETSAVPNSGNLFIFSRGTASGGVDARLGFYSIGESIDLALLDARLTTYMAALT